MRLGLLLDGGGHHHGLHHDLLGLGLDLGWNHLELCLLLLIWLLLIGSYRLGHLLGCEVLWNLHHHHLRLHLLLRLLNHFFTSMNAPL